MLELLHPLFCRSKSVSVTKTELGKNVTEIYTGRKTNNCSFKCQARDHLDDSFVKILNVF